MTMLLIKRPFVQRLLAVIVLIFIYILPASAGADQIRQTRKVNENSNYLVQTKMAVDSAIQSVSREVQSLALRSNLSSEDSAHLKELSSRLTFLTQLAIQFSSIQEDKQTILQDKLSMAILIFGVLTIVTILFFQRKEKTIGYMTFKLLGIVFIGTVSVFLIPAGFDNNQITPIVGLLGTLAGYLIGSTKPNSEPENVKREP